MGSFAPHAEIRRAATAEDALNKRVELSISGM